jgi:tRNA nucleotidyltransferase (CCA-adding enzyme)
MSGELPQRLASARIPDYVMRTVRALHRANHQAYLVGGCVRDLLRGLPPKDYDVTTSAKPEAVLGLFPRTVPTGIQHGTVTVVQPEGHVEVTTFRGEVGYADGRRPDQVYFLEQVEGDLARRDFTMNAIAFDPDRRELVDPFDGAGDLGRRLVRCVGEADARFGEDGLRPLRAVRFASVLRFQIHPDTRDSIPRARATYEKVAVERVSDELRKLLKGPRPSRGLELLVQTQLIDRILPALLEEAESERVRRFRSVNFTPPSFPLRLMALFRGHSASLEALRLPNDLVQRAEHVDRFRVPLQASTDPELRRFASRVGTARIHDVLVLERAALLARADRQGLRTFYALRDRLEALLEGHPPLTVGQLALNGNQVAQALGGKGPQVGQALKRLLEAVLDDPAQNTPERLLALLQAPPGA